MRHEVRTPTEVLRKAKLASMPPDVLECNIYGFAETYCRLRNFADWEQRSILEVAQDVDLTSTWGRLSKDILQGIRDIHSMQGYIALRRQHETYCWVRQWWAIKRAQKRVIRDTGDIAEVFARFDAHRESVGWAIYNKYGSMRDLIAQHDTLCEEIVAAETTIVRKIDEINEYIDEFMDMIPSVEEALALNDRHGAIMEPLVADLDRLVVERGALTQRIYDYEAERRRLLHQPSLESEARPSHEVLHRSCDAIKRLRCLPRAGIMIAGADTSLIII